MAKRKLYELTMDLRCAVVVSATSKKAAIKAVDTWERAWFETGELLGCVDTIPEIVDVRDGDKEQAHIVA